MPTLVVSPARSLPTSGQMPTTLAASSALLVLAALLAHAPHAHATVDSAAAGEPAPTMARASATAAAPRPAPRIELGQPSVVSQRGQRLKVAVPYGAAPGERVSPMRVSVVSVATSDGSAAPSAQGFTVMRPEQRNLLWLQSREPVTASRVTLSLRVAGQDELLRYELAVPPIRFAAASAPEVSAAAPRRSERTSRGASGVPPGRRNTAASS